MALTLESPDDLLSWVGKEIAVTEWVPISQTKIEQFAAVTGDQQWIHTDPDRASRESPYGGTVAHGFLTLSLLSQFLRQALEIRSGVRMAINYGLNRVRFPAPLRAGTAVRARFTLNEARKLSDAVEVVFAVVIEDQNAAKPCCVAEWVARYYR
jgi:acyl dehydratase